MAALTIFESQIAAKRPAPVVTGQAAHRLRRRKVFRCARRSYLPRLRGARYQVVALGASQALTWSMIGVAEPNAKRCRICGGAGVALLLMTDATGGDVSSR